MMIKNFELHENEYRMTMVSSYLKKAVIPFVEWDHNNTLMMNRNYENTLNGQDCSSYSNETCFFQHHFQNNQPIRRTIEFHHDQ